MTRATGCETVFMRLGHGALAARLEKMKEDKMNEQAVPAGQVDTRKVADEVGELLAGIRAGRIWFDENESEFLTYPEEGGREPMQEGVELASLSDWLNQQLDLTVWYKRRPHQRGETYARLHGKAGPEFEVAGFEVLITYGGPTVRLSYMGAVSGDPVFYHSWGFPSDKATVRDKDPRNRNREESLGDWIIDTLQEMEG